MGNMFLWVALLMSHCFWGLSGAAAEQSSELERIEKCGTRCSQDLQCKTKRGAWFPPPCQDPAQGLNSSSVFAKISLSTVMSCEGRQKCSLHLQIKTAVHLTESIHGVSICTVTAGMMSNCQMFTFTKASRGRMSGRKVEVENNCFDISPSQHVQVTVKTVPSYCGVTWTSTYEAPGCINKDLRQHVPECITGKLSYDVKPERKELSVRVTDMLEDYDYFLRLCRNDFICKGTGAETKIKKGDPVMSATLPYSRPLPCLCIEGWSLLTDAPRVQVCPFKDRLEELWFGINFDPLEETLSWEPECQVSAVVALCQKRDDGVCLDLPHASQKVSREKITFAKVDPHPQLCMKFTAGPQSWVKCPFADATFKAWEVVVTRQQGQEDVKMLSRITATFSVGQCVKSEGSTGCQITDTHTMHVEKNKPVDFKLEGEMCNSCLEVKRLDVKFAATVIHCLEQCQSSSPPSAGFSRRASLDWTWVVVPASVCLSGIIIITLLLNLLLTVYQRRKQNMNGGCISEKQIDPAFDCVVPVLPTKSALHGGVLVPDSPQCGNNEKANLISH
ncbi:putative interleukin-17 receptor E-like [Trematomus bernacchii]|uniref:putative interleukin-17 receptor E-like n=1 Tax=Trematomus bernacchii TaxID=40690 RepID=UPI00146D02F1|nr:putative interleukin-17 receptor E-like [Trematomus bernacchii]